MGYLRNMASARLVEGQLVDALADSALDRPSELYVASLQVIVADPSLGSSDLATTAPLGFHAPFRLLESSVISVGRLC
jgi:hypothetical protein